MNAFDIEKAIGDWKRDLSKQQGLEPGLIEEIEGNLRDRMEDLMDEGHNEADAFAKAREKCMPEPRELANEYYVARSNGNAKPPWERRAGLFSKMPLHFKVAIRSLSKRRAYTTLNVSGLALSLCISFLIWLYIKDQKSYDKHFTNADRIYRVIYDVRHDGMHVPQADVGQPVGPNLKADFPEVIEKARLRRIGATNTLATETISLESVDYFVADEDFFKVFDVEVIAGNAEAALSEPNTVILTESLARQFFGRTDVVGEVLKYSGVSSPKDIKVGAVMKDMGQRTHLPLKALISYPTYFDERELINWLRKSYTYLLLDEQNDIASVRAKEQAFSDQYLAEVFQRRVSPNAEVNLLFQPLKEIYLADGYLGEPYPIGNKTHLNILATVMIFLLVMASINYINLATARAMERALEVGIRKTLGSSRQLLLVQFLSESVVLALLSGVIALILALPVLSFFSDLTGMNLSVVSFLTVTNVASLLLMALVLGLLAGLYPGFYLTRFDPKTVLIGRFATGRKGALLRKSLVIAQYAIASVLIIWIFIVSQQIGYMKTKEVGFDKDGIIELILPDDPAALNAADVFLKEVSQLPGIRAASKTRADLSYGYGTSGQLMEGPTGEQVNTVMGALGVSYDWVETIGAHFVKGRDFNRLNTDEKGVIINEAAARAYGWEGNELDVKYLGRDRQGDVTGKWKVVGVVSDFKPGKSYEPAGPLILFLNAENRPEMKLLVGVNERDPIPMIPEIAAIWERHFLDHPFEFQLVSEKLKALYASEETLMNLLTLLCLITIFITALGIVGLISFTTETRKKEIAIRKVNGARIESILLLLSKQFGVLLLVASLVAIPLGYYISNRWLTNFELRIDLGIAPILVVVPICLVFTAMAVVYHALRAARANPVEALRAE